jgi:hypothetical protein
MKSVKFPEVNLALAEEQVEYETLHVYVEPKIVPHPTVPGKEVTIAYSMTSCFELTDAEIEEIVKTRKVWHRQMTFGNQFQPILMTTQDPFTLGIIERPNPVEK